MAICHYLVQGFDLGHVMSPFENWFSWVYGIGQARKGTKTYDVSQRERLGFSEDLSEHG